MRDLKQIKGLPGLYKRSDGVEYSLFLDWEKYLPRRMETPQICDIHSLDRGLSMKWQVIWTDKH
jgi:hypothetical protein